MKTKTLSISIDEINTVKVYKEKDISYQTILSRIDNNTFEMYYSDTKNTICSACGSIVNEENYEEHDSCEVEILNLEEVANFIMNTFDDCTEDDRIIININGNKFIKRFKKE